MKHGRLDLSVVQPLGKETGVPLLAADLDNLIGCKAWTVTGLGNEMTGRTPTVRGACRRNSRTPITLYLRL